MDSIRSFFVYGTLMTGFHLHEVHLTGHPLTTTRGTVAGKLYHLPAGYPALVPGDGVVSGELLTLNGSEQHFLQLVSLLDQVEGFLGEGAPNNLYIRRTVSVQTEDGVIPAFGYYYANIDRAKTEGLFVPGGDWRSFMSQSKSVNQVVVDADACPRNALQILRRLKREYGYRLVTVASFNHRIEGTDHITVGDGPDEADLAIVNRIDAGDLVITQDWGLASLVLAKGGRALSPHGHVYDPVRIDFLLDERHKKAKARRAGIRTRGPKARSSQDDVRFERNLRDLLDRPT